MKWTPELAYVIGLITTDGNLSKDNRHIELTSKDIEQIKTFASILGLKNKIGLKTSSFTTKKYYRIQFSNVKFYRFLLKIGLMPNKTKLLGPLKIPKRFFRDFLRGHLDGDGYTYSLWDKRWKSSYRLYTVFLSASKAHLEWIQEKINSIYDLKGPIKYSGKSIYTLSYAKKSSLLLLPKLYYKDNIPCLERKKSKIIASLDIIQEHAGVEKLVYSLP